MILVVDGDGVRLDCDPGREHLNVRLYCIDAPESGYVVGIGRTRASQPSSPRGPSEVVGELSETGDQPSTPRSLPGIRHRKILLAFRPPRS